MKSIKNNLSHTFFVKLKGFKLREFAIGLRLRWRIKAWTEHILPDFIIIGEKKAGTTSLYRYLIQHPNIVAPLRKEIGRFLFAKNYNTKLVEPWYRAHFPSQKIRNHESITGEANPNYFFHPLAPRRIAGLVPNVKLIVLLRNPIDRAYSHYHHNLRLRTQEPLSFGDAIENEDERLKGAKEQILIERGGWGNKNCYRSYSYLSRGIYINSLNSWFNFFPREQFLILSSENLSKTPIKTVKRVINFLELPMWQPKITKKFNVGKYPKVSTHTRKKLKKFFEPHNQQLYDMLSVDFGWES